MSFARISAILALQQKSLQFWIHVDGNCDVGKEAIGELKVRDICLQHCGTLRVKTFRNMDMKKEGMIHDFT